MYHRRCNDSLMKSNFFRSWFSFVEIIHRIVRIVDERTRFFFLLKLFLFSVMKARLSCVEIINLTIPYEQEEEK
jgi:hypothetical protein